MAKKEIPWFYHPDFAVQHLLPDETRHALSSLRLKERDAIVLTDGKGSLARAQISVSNKAGIQLHISEVIKTELHRLDKALIIGRMHHPDRMEWLVEKVQELGIGRLLVAEMDACGKGSLNVSRLQRVAVSALKQSHQTWLCVIEYYPTLEAALDHVAGKGAFGYLPDDDSIPASISTHYDADFAVIGPEADFSDREVRLMMQAGLTPVNMGPARLRTETAGLAAAVFLQIN